MIADGGGGAGGDDFNGAVGGSGGGANAYGQGSDAIYRNNQFNTPYWADQETGAQPNMF